MNVASIYRSLIVGICAGLLVMFIPSAIDAHCDSMSGPVVTAAKKALETGNINHVLIWVQKKDETEIRRAFEQTIAVRKLNAQAMKFADMYFFEMLVRVHRAGEGVAYTGLKPAETIVDPGIHAAEEALERGSAEELVHHLNEAIHRSIHKKFTEALAKKKFDVNNVDAGREYVKAYVEFIHYIEQLHQLATQTAAGHLHESAGPH